MKTNRLHKGRRHRRMLALLLAGTLTGGIAVAVLLISPYAATRMDMALMELPAVHAPATLLAYDPACREARSGPLHIAPNSHIADPEKRIFVPLSDMPPDLIHAFVAIEDKRFYDHYGVDIPRTLHAALSYVTSGGKGSFGGSTITQQLVKNLTGEDAPTPDRKLRELFCAMDLERRTDKDAILETYLNIINVAGGCRGVGAAAMRYFSKAPAELTLSECAAIAAITNNPARLDPLTHPEANRARRDLILREMAAQGYVSEAVASDAIKAPLTLHPGLLQTPQKPESIATQQTSNPSANAPIASWYADMVVEDVIRDLMTRYGYTRKAATRLVYTAGLTVETAMDETLQSIVEDYFANEAHFPVGDNGRPQAAFILIDPATGDILAVAGAVGEKNGNRLQNYATDTYRPAGSCIKPLSVYAPAIESGVASWATMLEDTPITKQNGISWPRNGDGQYRGTIPLCDAVAFSSNPAAVRLLRTVGLHASLTLLSDRLGIKSLCNPTAVSAEDATLSALALGQGIHGVTTRELTAAYDAFYDGIYRPPISYHRVLDRDGKVILENNPPTEEARVWSPETAAILTRLLGGVVENGTAAGYLTLPKALGIPCAGKTGTTQENCDRRFVGYTPRLLGGAWMGYDYPKPLAGIRGNPCISLWNELLTACESAYEGAERSYAFALPADVVEAPFCPLSGACPTEWCMEGYTGEEDGDLLPEPVPNLVTDPVRYGYFKRGKEPTVPCTRHREPPIHLVPNPEDPERIPLLPDDILPTLPPDPAEEDASPLSDWFRRFTRFRIR